MDRRDFFRRAALIAAGTVAVDQLELLERLTHRRRFFPGWTAKPFRYPEDYFTRASDSLALGEPGWSQMEGTWGIGRVASPFVELDCAIELATVQCGAVATRVVYGGRPLAIPPEARAGDTVRWRFRDGQVAQVYVIRAGLAV